LFRLRNKNTPASTVLPNVAKRSEAKHIFEPELPQ
jgi:hypothetical protein